MAWRGRRCWAAFARPLPRRQRMRGRSMRSGGGIARGYRRVASLDREAILELLEDRLRDYDAMVVRARAGGVAAEIACLIAARNVHRIVVPVGLAEALGEALPGDLSLRRMRGFLPRSLMASRELLLLPRSPSRRRERSFYRTCRGREGARQRWCRTITCAWCGQTMWWRRCRRRWIGWRRPRRWRRRSSLGHRRRRTLR
jgi:hypothetical protein